MKLTRNNLAIACLFFGFLGFLDSTYLTILHFRNAFPPCTISGCDTVLASQYSMFLGLPLSLFGSIFYLVIIAFSLAILLHKRKIYAHGLFLSAFIGLFISAILFFVQLFEIKSFCQYCLLSELFSVLVFISCSFMYSRFLKS